MSAMAAKEQELSRQRQAPRLMPMVGSKSRERDFNSMACQNYIDYTAGTIRTDSRYTTQECTSFFICISMQDAFGWRCNRKLHRSKLWWQLFEMRSRRSRARSNRKPARCRGTSWDAVRSLQAFANIPGEPASNPPSKGWGWELVLDFQPVCLVFVHLVLSPLLWIWHFWVSCRRSCNPLTKRFQIWRGANGCVLQPYRYDIFLQIGKLCELD